MKSTICFTILATLVLGMLCGIIQGTNEFEAREGPEKVTIWAKCCLQFSFLLFAFVFYVAGTEYHGLKNKLKKSNSK